MRVEIINKINNKIYMYKGKYRYEIKGEIREKIRCLCLFNTKQK